MANGIPSSTRLDEAERLIALGRDREAVVAATRDLAADDTENRSPRAGGQGEPMDGAQQLDQLARDALTPAMRDGDTFAEATAPPSGSSPLEHLVAFTGRQLPDKVRKPQ